MAEGASAISGTERAAILLLTLGEQAAASILKHMDVEEVHRVGAAMAAMNDVPRDRVIEVLGELLTAVETKTPFGIGTDEYVRAGLTESLGARRAASLLERIIDGRESKGIDALEWMEPRTVANVLRNEHPQIVATILAHFKARQAADVLARLPAPMQTEVAIRLARLEEVPESALAELDALVERQARESAGLRTARLGGVRAAADIINLLPPDAEAAVLEAIKAEDGALGEEIQDALFLFENLLKVDDRAMQLILRDVQSETLVIALKGADEAMRTKVFSNMSKRAADILRDDLAAKGPVKLADVDAAQKEILGIAQRLADEGKITLGGGDFV